MIHPPSGRTPSVLALIVLDAMGQWFAPGADRRRIPAISAQWLVDIVRLREDDSEPPTQNP